MPTNICRIFFRLRANIGIFNMGSLNKMAVNHLVNEVEILALIAEGDQSAFTILFNHYQRFVFSFGKKITHSEESAGEVVQDIFLKIWLARESLPEVKNFGAYLNRLVRNHSLNVVRRQLQEARPKTSSH